MKGGRCRSYKIYTARHGSKTSSSSHIAVVQNTEKGLHLKTTAELVVTDQGPPLRASQKTFCFSVSRRMFCNSDSARLSFYRDADRRVGPLRRTFGIIVSIHHALHAVSTTYFALD
ncbi:hypothetical protein NDU88_003897 [Pleurodeles waltl]|uniref:Uncharacterized protein n=1 Tax=Pleurodeles waltl TaxID=8319 RepID=A0AAV7KWW1_PLEWA|nr:hypothetical protein NDU88_003897 [Pleurodeles waltl]